MGSAGIPKPAAYVVQMHNLSKANCSKEKERLECTFQL